MIESTGHRGKVRYAAYGSNLHPVRLSDRLASARLIGSGPLPGYTLSFSKRSVDGSGKCTIAAGGDGVHVAVYEISEADKRRLDGIEGVGQGYRDEVIDVPGFGRCATYLGSRSWIDPQVRPYDWYRDLVLLGCRYHGFPPAYIGHVAAVGADFDPDAGRRETNTRLIRQMRR